MRYLIPNIDPRDVETEAQLQAFLVECDRCERENAERYTKGQKYKQDLLLLAAALWGEGSRQHKYNRTEAVPKPPQMNTLRNKARKAYREAEERAEARAAYQRRKSRQEAAMDALEAAGYEWGVDFGTGHAITKAKAWLTDWEHGDFTRREGAPLPRGYEMPLEVVP